MLTFPFIGKVYTLCLFLFFEKIKGLFYKCEEFCIHLEMFHTDFLQDSVSVVRAVISQVAIILEGSVSRVLINQVVDFHYQDQPLDVQKVLWKYQEVP